MTQNEVILRAVTIEVFPLVNSLSKQGLDETGSPAHFSLTFPLLIPYGMASHQLQLAAQALGASFRKQLISFFLQ